MNIQLGDIARDSISGYEGVVIAKTEWLYGCIRLTLQASGLHDGKPLDAVTIDEPQCIWVESKGSAQRALAKTGGPVEPPSQHAATPRR